MQGVATKPRLRRPHRYRRHRIQPAERRIEISATVSEAVASAFENKKALPKEGSLVVLIDIAGGGIRTRDLRVMSSLKAIRWAHPERRQAR